MGRAHWGEPLGLLNAPDINTVAGASFAYAGAMEAQDEILTANALSEGGEVSFLCRSAVAKLFATRQGYSTNESLWVGPLANGLLAGCRAFTSQSVPATTLVGGDFSQMLVAEFGVGLESG